MSSIPDVKADKRRNVPYYLDILMECKVSSDEHGVTFDTSHPAWQRLIDIVNRADQADSEAQRAIEEARRGNVINTSPTSSTGGSDGETDVALAVHSRRMSGIEHQAAMKANLSAYILSALPQAVSPLIEQLQMEIFGKEGTIPPTDTNSPPSIQSTRHPRSIDQVNTNLVRKWLSSSPVPQSLRADVWAVLLGASDTESTLSPNASNTNNMEPLDLNNQRVVKVCLLILVSLALVSVDTYTCSITSIPHLHPPLLIIPFFIFILARLILCVRYHTHRILTILKCNNSWK